jgi:GT2 family glycosyltransferase
MSLPTLSVVIPHYNHGQYVRRAVEAMAGQSARPLEILIVDDGSTDGSGPLLRELAETVPAVQVHHNDRNRGVGYTCNRGLSLARGEYVYLAAADDLVLPGFFEKALTLIRDHPQAGLVCGKRVMTDTADNVLHVFEVPAWQTARYARPDQFLHEYLEREDPGHSLCGATIYRREALREMGGYRTELGHWMDTFVARAIGLRHGICYIPEQVTKWRYSEQGVAGGSRWDEQVRVIRRAAELMRSESFRKWFPADYVARWEPAALDYLCRARVLGGWRVLRRWDAAGGWRTRVARLWLRALTRLGRWRWQRSGPARPARVDRGHGKGEAGVVRSAADSLSCPEQS